MTPADRLRMYHARLSAQRWVSDLYDVDADHWRGSKRPKKALAILEAHLRRCHGRGSPAECDEAIQEALK
jgi:hypothetical protein